MQRPASQPAPTQLFGALLRLVWMLAANAAIALMVVLIGTESGGRLSWRDALLWAAAGAAVLARWVDITRYAGTTADGQQATMQHFRRHALKLALLSGLGWAAVHLWGMR